MSRGLRRNVGRGGEPTSRSQRTSHPASSPRRWRDATGLAQVDSVEAMTWRSRCQELCYDLVERLPRWNIHPEVTVTHRFPLDQAANAYATMDGGASGKVAIVFE